MQTLCVLRTISFRPKALGILETKRITGTLAIGYAIREQLGRDTFDARSK